MRERRERTGRGCGDKMIRSEFWGYPKLPGILLEIIFYPPSQLEQRL
jgi:hypothetical protein